MYGVLVVLSTAFVMATALSVADFLRILFDEGSESHVAGGNLVAQWLEGLYVWMIAHGRMTALMLFSVLVLVLYGLKNVFTYLSAVQIGVIRCRLVRDMRNDMFAKSMRLGIDYYGRQREGDVLSRFGGDISEYEENVLGSVQMLITSIVSIVMYLAMLVYMDFRLTLVVLACIPVVVFAISGLSRRLKRKSKHVQESGSYLLSLLEEAMRGLRVIKAFNAIEFSNRRFKSYNAEYSKERISMFRRIYAASPVSDFLGNTIVIIILMFGAWIVMGGDSSLSAELFVSYIMLFVLMIPPAKDLSTAVSQIKRGKGCVERINEFLETDMDECEVGTAQADHIGAIALSDVCFSYGAADVLQHVSITVPQGKRVALVGASGSGKSTIANLLLRFYNIRSGVITADGRDITQFSLRSWRQHIGVVSQETMLLNDTVRNNIAFGQEGVTDEEVVAAAKAANAHDFIMQLPEGYDTNVGDGGSLLSGGQRQRICIARAIVRNPELLILDEATSALDSESEQLVQQGIEGALKGRTALVIAHRLSTIKDADNIIVLQNGQVAEQGTHSELLQRQGIYHHMIFGGGVE